MYARAVLGGVALGLAALLIFGFRVDGLPFIPGSQYSDSATSHYPAALFLRDTVLTQREIPLWRETIMAGAPFAANPLNKTGYPPQWLALLLPPVVHVNVLLLGHVVLAAAGMAWWARGVGVSRAGAALAALAYALAPRMIAHGGAGHVDIVYALAWLPWLFGAAVRLGRTGDLRWMLTCGLAAALLVLSDVRVSLFGMATALALFAAQRPAGRAWRRGGMALALAAVASCGVWLPLAGWWPYLSRGALTTAEAGVFSLPAGALIGLALPGQSGNPELLVYAGLPVLVLALLALAPRWRRLWGYALLLAIALIWALGVNTPLWTALVDSVPALRVFRVPARAWLIVAALLPLLAGMGLDEMLLRPVLRRAARLLVVAALAAALCAGAFALLALPLPARAGLSLCLAGGGVLALLLAAGRLPRRPLLALIFALTAGDLLIQGRAWIEWRTADAWLAPYLPLAERLKALDAGRVYAPAYSLPQQAAEAAGVDLFGGVDPFQIAAVSRAIEAAGGLPESGYSVVMPPLTDAASDDLSNANAGFTPDAGLLAVWGVTHVIAPYDIGAPGLALLDKVGDVRIYQNMCADGQPRRWSEPDWPQDWPGLPDASTVAQLNDLTAAAQAGGMLALLAGAGGLAALARRRR